MDTDSFINIITEDVYENIEDNVTFYRFDTSNYEVNRPLSMGKSKKLIGLIKYELGGKIMTKSVTLRPKTYSYLMDDNNATIKKAKETKKCIIEKILKFNDYEN